MLCRVALRTQMVKPTEPTEILLKPLKRHKNQGIQITGQVSRVCYFSSYFELLCTIVILPYKLV